MIRRKPPQVPKPGGGRRERARTKLGTWFNKRSDAGKRRKR